MHFPRIRYLRAQFHPIVIRLADSLGMLTGPISSQTTPHFPLKGFASQTEYFDAIVIGTILPESGTQAFRKTGSWCDHRPTRRPPISPPSIASDFMIFISEASDTRHFNRTQHKQTFELDTCIPPHVPIVRGRSTASLT
jgi:hypothetical protein